MPLGQELLFTLRLHAIDSLLVVSPARLEVPVRRIRVTHLVREERRRINQGCLVARSVGKRRVTPTLTRLSA
ncbi:MAG: hypothetical protein ACI8X5_002453 [Planctomycetota bacterium]|jgi:hypothetical protein